jgi:enoyl-CoA hydratase/carnithine racemase
MVDYDPLSRIRRGFMSIQSKIINGIGHIFIDRPEKANAYDRVHLDALASDFARLATTCPVIVIASAHPRFFCAGADLDALKMASPADAKNLRSQAVFSGIARSAAISIAVIEGSAIAGGCELALATDLRVIGADAVFRLPETSLGIIPAAGGCTRLPAMLGEAIAKTIILGGGEISATQAVAWGLGVDGGDDPMGTATQWAKAIKARPAEAQAAAKRIINTAAEDRSLRDEREAQAILYAKFSG